MDSATRDAPRHLLDAPFTPAMAAAAGLGRSALERRVRDGTVVKVLRGVYVASGRTLRVDERAAALALVLGRRQAAVGRTAAWLHGCARDALLVGLDPTRGVPVELRAVNDLRDRSVRIGPVRAERALDAALGLVGTTPRPTGLAVLDSLVRVGAVTAQELYEAAAHRGCPRTREVVARIDARAADAAESVLRDHWYGARLPTPVPGAVVAGIRVSLALPWQRFGVMVGASPGPRAPGWSVIRLPAERVLQAVPDLIRLHLEREFHQHLLRSVG